jgi:ketosteroid isomerase-like protein
MSRENVEVVRRSVEAFNREDVRTLAELSDDDVELVSFVTARVEQAEGGTIRLGGPDLWTSYFADRHETWQEWRIEDLRLFDGGDDRVAVVFRLIAKGRASGVRLDQAVGAVYRLRQGKLWRIRTYLDPREALEAVGLSD